MQKIELMNYKLKLKERNYIFLGTACEMINEKVKSNFWNSNEKKYDY